MSFTFAPCPQCRRLNRVTLASAETRAPVCGQCKVALSVHGPIVDTDEAGLAALVAKSPLPVVADFWAPWCGPCKAFAPTFEASAAGHAGSAVFVKVNTQSYPGAGERYNVRGIPTLIAFHAGGEIDRVSGALPPPAFEQWLARVKR